MTDHEREWKVFSYGYWIGVGYGCIAGIAFARLFYEVTP